jgi:hypothetical protein
MTEKISMFVSFSSEDMPDVNVEVDQKQYSDFKLLEDFLRNGNIDSLALDSEVDCDRFKVRALAFLDLISDLKYNELEEKLTELDG